MPGSRKAACGSGRSGLSSSVYGRRRASWRCAIFVLARRDADRELASTRKPVRHLRGVDSLDAHDVDRGGPGRPSAPAADWRTEWRARDKNILQSAIFVSVSKTVSGSWVRRGFKSLPSVPPTGAPHKGAPLQAWGRYQNRHCPSVEICGGPQ